MIAVKPHGYWTFRISKTPVVQRYLPGYILQLFKVAAFILLIQVKSFHGNEKAVSGVILDFRPWKEEALSEEKLWHEKSGGNYHEGQLHVAVITCATGKKTNSQCLLLLEDTATQLPVLVFYRYNSNASQFRLELRIFGINGYSAILKSVGSYFAEWKLLL